MAEEKKITLDGTEWFLPFSYRKFGCHWATIDAKGDVISDSDNYDEAEHIAAALNHYAECGGEADGGWLPIETADTTRNTEILIYRRAKNASGYEYGECRVVGYGSTYADEEQGWWDEHEGEFVDGVTHWRPLPKPPKGENNA